MKPTPVFQAERLEAGYDHKTVVDGVSLVVPSGRISVIIGANGCGKSTLLKTLARLIKPSAGQVTLDGRSIGSIAPKQLARTVGILPQSPIVPEGISVADLVGRGRYPHQPLLGGWSKKDTAAVAEAMDLMRVTEFADKPIDELSGGQRQRVWIAMALAQQTDILFLDEPTTYLDITYQVEILDLLTDLNRDHGTTIVMVLHDINLSARYADYIFALHEGKLVAEGKPADVVTGSLVKDIFGLDCTVIEDPVSGTPLVVPRGRHHVSAGRS
ncbi:Iron compound ABC uptake transporter ATP-binding protein PiaD [Paenibacillus pasadenensis]|uniref:Iron compound ABC uptake transporter ATP-binding protein PiaD n=1 Tax=Paenibacillus pasadenensis TaxID=217090 RepID=A0A2N5NCL1_9BACL|nr:ABC transporter ATP-binding protein [Paenibacillus pasadenensis]PLT48074.1 Iron compound ABC uptake transporter ATP-binding protein PiaD [Paenibacillus pasadenensis]